MTLVSLSTLENIFRTEVMGILGLTDSATAPAVRISWPTEGSPDWKIDDDVIFLQLTDVGGDDIAQPIDTEYSDNGDDLTKSDSSTRVLQLSLIAYGPNSYDNLVAIRHAFFNGRENLRNNAIYPIPASDSPKRAPELFQARWWERADLALRFNHLTTFEENVRTITEVDVTVEANKPGLSTDTIFEGIIIKKG